MATKFERGILVDYEGYFMAALQWEAGTPAPKFARRSKNKPLPGEAQTFLLRSQEAIDTFDPSGRWDFNASRWQLPTEVRWIVTIRRDKPDLGSLAGQRTVWPDRLPPLPQYQRYVDVAPPEGSAARRPSFRFSTAEWLLPVPKLAVAADGTVESFSLQLLDGDVQAPDGGTVIDPPDAAADEVGNVRPAEVGDRIVGGSLEKQPPRYRRVPVRILRRALINAGLAQDFLTFLSDNGITEEQVDSLESISLNTKLLRDFVAAQGFTMPQAYNALQRAAEQIEDADRQFATAQG